MNEMFLAKNLTQLTNLSLFFAICSVVTYAVTSIVKPLTKSLISNANLRKFTIQLFSCSAGGFVGYEMSSFSTLGLWLGFGSGALNVVVVSHLRSQLTNGSLDPMVETPTPSSQHKAASLIKENEDKSAVKKTTANAEDDFD